MKTNLSIMKFLFIFLFTVLLASCTSQDVEDEIAFDENENNELSDTNNFETFLLDKTKSDRPGNQGPN